MFNVFTRFLTPKLWAVFGGILVVFVIIWYIQHLRNTVSSQEAEIEGLNYALNEVVKVYENNLQELTDTKIDHAVQLDLLENGFMKYNENNIVVSDLEARIRYVTPEDDGIVAPVLSSTIRLLREATIGNDGSAKE